MSISLSVLEQLLEALPHLRTQIYFKSSLTALSHAMEDQVLAEGEPCLIIASFQRERFYRQEAQRYRRIAGITPHVYLLSSPDTDFVNASQEYEQVAFEPSDQLSQEWHLVVVGPRHSACLICREKLDAHDDRLPIAMDQNRRFEGVWTFDRQVSCESATILLERILGYRPELAKKIEQSKAAFLPSDSIVQAGTGADPFAQRLITYLQAGQYKLLKAYRAMMAQGRREQLVNVITSTIRQSLNPEEIFSIAVQELGQVMQVDRCIIYPCRSGDRSATIRHEFLRDVQLTSLLGEVWPLDTNPLFRQLLKEKEAIAIEAIAQFSDLNTDPLLPLCSTYQINGWLVVPITHQGKLVGIIELMTVEPMGWSNDDRKMVNAIASQLGVALIQADAYANLELVNAQLEDLEQTRSNLIAITGHELRTPLSTIQVCLESLATEPDMPREMQDVMLSTALNDAERLRKLVQDFLTLSRLESGRVDWHLESLSLDECVELALSSIKIRQHREDLPQIDNQVTHDLPFITADGEWIVEVLSKLLDNACKFTSPDGTITITAQAQPATKNLEVSIADTGRGIEESRLETVFDRFYQEEGALRRTTSGTGLGLAICRQVIQSLGGHIWATSNGKGKGSTFHFTVPTSSIVSTA